MKILEYRQAPNPRRVRIFLAEKGIAVPYEQIDIANHEHLAPEFTRINPTQRVPVLILDDGTAIAETIAICRYFEATTPEPRLFGETPTEQGLVEMWTRRIEHGLLFHIAQAFRHTNPRMAERERPQVMAWGEANRERILPALVQLDRDLATRPFIAGEHYSVADITALVAVDFMRVLKLSMPEDLKHLAAWHGVVSARPSAAA